MKITNASRRQISVLRNMRRKKYRQEQEMFMAEGVRTVVQILENDEVDVVSVYLDEDNSEALRSFIDPYSLQIDCYSLPHDIFLEVTDTENPQGAIALCRVPPMSPLERWTDPKGCLVALDGLRDPGNMGTIIRTGTWFGVEGLLMSRDTVDLFHPKVVRSTAGATGVLSYHSGELSESLSELKEQGWNLFFLEDRPGAVSIKDRSAMDGIILVIGNEAHGIRLDHEVTGGQSLRIPGGTNHSEVESLNAAVAASIAMYELTSADI